MSILKSIVQFILGFGFPGIFVLAALDSMFLFYLPFAMDTLFILFVSQNRETFPYLVLLTVAGSLTGVTITYIIISKSGGKWLEKFVPKKKLDKVKEKIENGGFWAISIAALMPPPFPFTPFLLAVCTTQIGLRKLLLAVGVGRLLRYVGEGVLALVLGSKILNWLESPVFHVIILGIFVLAVAGSILTIIRWSRSRR